MLKELARYLDLLAIIAGLTLFAIGFVYLGAPWGYIGGACVLWFLGLYRGGTSK